MNSDRHNPTQESAPTPLRPESRVRIPRHVVHRDFPTQTVVLNLETGKYHGLNPTAGKMLTSLEQMPTLAAAARAIAECYHRPQAQVERDLCALCAQLLERGIVELVDSPPG